ncbi:MAG: RecX family transcriptional regulator [Eubacteriales bacterium]|nr:RecX family transcriptional regulator [Eubacteriales bacterium]
MAYNITEVSNFDNKRNKVTLDYSEVTFLLYKGECRKLGISTDMQLPKELSDEAYRDIMDEILIPRAKKRILYYLKNGDKTRTQIKRKLKEGLYPDEVIEETFKFLDKYGFADDSGYADRYIEELRGNKSKREIEMKLSEKGIRGSEVKEKLSLLSAEDEYEACERTLKRKYPGGVTKEDRNKAFAYLARRGFSYDSIEHAFNSCD